MNNYTITLILKETYTAFQQIQNVEVKCRLVLFNMNGYVRSKKEVYHYLSTNQQFIPVCKESNEDIIFYNKDTILRIIAK